MTAPPEILCPLCRVPADPVSLLCPACSEDLAVLVHLRLRGRIRYNEGLRLARHGDTAAAAAALEQALSEDPGLLEAHLLLGKARAAAGDRPRARESFGQVLRLQPGHPGAAAALARLAELDGTPG